MSLRASTWVLYESPVVDPTQVLVLWALADRADEHGRAAYPGQDWIAGRARCTTRTVRRHLGALERDGHIRRGDQQLVAHFRPDRRPIVWDVVMVESERQDILSARNDRTPEVATTGHPRSNDRTPMSYKPSVTVPTNRTEEISSSVTFQIVRAREDDGQSSTQAVGGAVDISKVIARMTALCGRDVDRMHAFALIGTALERAKGEPRNPTAYVLGVLKNDPIGWQNYIDTGRVPA